MNSAWIQHQSDLNCCTKHCAIQAENEISMKSAWIQHEFNTDLISITVQSIVKKSVYKSFSKHYSLSVSYLTLNQNSYSPTKNHGLAPNSKPPTQTTSFFSVDWNHQLVFVVNSLQYSKVSKDMIEGIIHLGT